MSQSGGASAQAGDARHIQGRYCVVIPAYRAAKTIGSVVRRVKAQGFSVVVVDDGSPDQTAAVAAAEGALVISHLRNEGKGCALRTGFEYALRMRYDGIVTLDSDGQHDPVEIHRLIRAAEVQHAGLVLGNRMADGAVMPQMRRWTNRVMSRLLSRLTHHDIPDSQCGFRVIRREVLQDVSLKTQRFEIESELLLRAARKRWKIISVPVRTIYQDHASHIQPLGDAVRFLMLVVRHLLQR